MRAIDMGVWVTDQTKKGWLTSIFELGAWFGCLYSGFFAEISVPKIRHHHERRHLYSWCRCSVLHNHCRAFLSDRWTLRDW